MTIELRVLLLTVLVASAACSASSLAVDRNDGAEAPDAATPTRPTTAHETGAGITVTGHAVDKSRPTGRLAGRSVVVLDAAGQRTATTTDDSGAFRVDGVVTPYDALVGGGAAGETPVVYLGLSTAMPQIGGWSSERLCTPRSSTIAIPVALAACGSVECHYEVSLSSAGYPLVGGASGQSYDPVTPPETLNVPASWCGDASTAIAVHLLTADAAYVRYAHASAPPIFVTDGVPTTASLVTPSAVSTAGTMTLSVASIGVPQSWGAPSTSIFLVYPNGGGVATLQSFEASYVETGVPDIAGATLSVQALFRDPAEPYAAALAEKKGVALATRESALTVNGAPVVTSPSNEGVIAVAGTIEWQPAGDRQVVDATLSTTGTTDGAVTLADVLTSGESIDLARLGALGIVVPIGPASLQLSTEEGVASLDAMVDAGTLATSDGGQTSTVDVAFSFAP